MKNRVSVPGDFQHIGDQEGRQEIAERLRREETQCGRVEGQEVRVEVSPVQAAEVVLDFGRFVVKSERSLLIGWPRRLLEGLLD
jgi:hypothetical protein